VSRACRFTAIGSVLVSMTRCGRTRRSGERRSRLPQGVGRRQRADDDVGARAEVASVRRDLASGAAMILASPSDNVVADHAVASLHQVGGNRRAHDAETDDADCRLLHQERCEWLRADG
jgi:hypothetical protein